MANITFLIGNGFDKCLGLKTSYQEFYESLNLESNNRIEKSILTKGELWADMELGLGESLSNYSQSNVDSFISDFFEIEDELTDYLKKENDRFKIVDSDKVSGSLSDAILSINSRLSQRHQQYFRRIVKSIAEPIHYSFICFNYTSVLDSVVKTLAEKPSFATHTFAANGKATDNVTMPLHIHGQLEDAMVVGVNDEMQIKNSELRANDTLLSVIVKPRENAGIGNDNTQSAKNMIESSKIIYVFGFSMGATDKMWNTLLFEWLRGSSDRLLILDIFDRKYNKRSASRMIKWENDVLEGIVKENNIDKAAIKAARDRICIIANSRIFSIEGYELVER